MEPPGSGTSAAPIGAVKAGTGITIAADGTISASSGGGTVTNVVANNGIQGGGTGPTVFLGLLPPAGNDLGGVKTVAGSGLSIDTDGVIRVATTTAIAGGPGIEVTDLGGDSYRIQALPATNAVLGSVIVPGGSNGLRVATNGVLSLAPAGPTVLGGIIPGTNCSVTPTGVLNVAGGGTITGVGVGTGLGGGGTSGAVTVFLNPASGSILGGVYQGDNITIAPDGRISAVTSVGVSQVTGTSPVIITGTSTNPNVTVNASTLTSPGVVTLTDSVASTSITTAATPSSVKQAYDLASNALPLSGGALTGSITFAVGQTFPGTVDSSTFAQLGGILVGNGSPSGYAQLPLGLNGQVLTVDSTQPLGVRWGALQLATTGAPGAVQPDGTTITVDGSGVISAVTGGGGLPLTGGTMTGDIVFAGTQTFPGTLPLAGGTMTGNITFNAGQTFPNTLPLSGGTLTGSVTFAAGQTFPGTVSSTLLDVTGDMVFASAANTPASLPIGAAGSILAVNGGIPAWRTSTQLGLLTSAAASTTYAPINSPTLSGPVTVNAGGAAGSNALTVSGGNLVLSTAFTPASSSDTGTVGEIAWDNTGYLYFCYLPNTWGRVQIDLTPF